VIHATQRAETLSASPYPGDGTVLRDLGVFSDSAELGVKNLDVSAAIADDYAQRIQRGNTSQYGLKFDSVSDDGAATTDYARFNCSSVQVDVTYLVP
jgi:hypothetical protein